MRLRAACIMVLVAFPGLAAADASPPKATALPDLAGPPPPGAMACSGCHGAGTSLSLTAEILEAMIGFKAGTREATLMNRIAAGFDEAEMAAIAAWIAGGN